MPINPSIMAVEAKYHGDQREKLPVIGSSGVTPVIVNATIQAGVEWPNLPARELFLTNDSAGDIQIVITCSGGTLSWVLHTGETFNERVPPFTSVAITTTGAYRWYVRGNLT
jgi:hypothetical protein